MRHSERAKKNTRAGIEARIALIGAKIRELREEKQIYIKYKKRGLNATFCNKVIRAINNKIITRTQQLNRYISRKQRWQREGKI